MSEFTQIAKALAEAYNRRGELEVELWKVGRAVEDRMAMIVPANGWPGSNADARKAAAEKEYVLDAPLVELRKREERARAEQVALTERINGLEATRRGLEWDVRSLTNRALMFGGVSPNGRGDRPEAAQDDASLSRIDQEQDQALAEHNPFDEVAEMPQELVDWLDRGEGSYAA